MSDSKKATGKAKKSKDERTYVSQKDVPRFPLSDALRVPVAIYENYGGDPTSPLLVAKALEMAPNAGHFRNLAGAAIGYGLTEGGPKAEEIKLTPLAERIVRPLEDSDDERARREALLTPRVINEFLRKYDGSPLPRDDIAYNVLESMGVPKSRTKEVYSLIREGAAEVGFLQQIKGKAYVHIAGATSSTDDRGEVPADEGDEDQQGDPQESYGEAATPTEPVVPRTPKGTTEDSRKKRVFITHGKDRSFLDPIKKLLAFGELDPVVATERQSVAKPVPEKVLDDMRGCGAAIIHVDAETRLLDQDAKEHVVLNPNVLIEIGAAMALYGRRFILLVKEGVRLPSNLQGLYEVRYVGDSLDGEVTIKLLEAIRDMKTQSLPD